MPLLSPGSKRGFRPFKSRYISLKSRDLERASVPFARQRSWRTSYALPAAAVTAIAAFHYFTGFGFRAPFLIYMPVVASAGLFAGSRAGFFSTALAALLALSIERGPGLAEAFVVFLVVGAFVSWACGLLHHTVELLRTAEAQMSAFAETVTDYAIFLLDPAGRVVTWPPAAERINGYTKAEIVGKHFSVFYTDKARSERWPERELEIAAREGSVKDEGWRVRKDGSLIWASVVITAMHDDQGRLAGFSKITRDLSESRLADEAERMRYLKAIIDAMPATVGYIDRNYRYVFTNKAYRQWYGYGAGEIEGKTVEEVAGPKLFAQFKERMDKALEGQRVTLEAELNDARFGGTRWIHTEYVPISGTESLPQGILSITLDITERKRLEAALLRKQTRNAEELKAAVDQRTAELRRTIEDLEGFTYTLSHDLRAPIRAVQGHSHLALRNPEVAKHPQLHTQLERIARAANRMDRLVKDLLTLTRAARAEEKLEGVNLDSIVADVLELHARDKEHISVVAPLGRVIARARPLRQAISALVDNAARFAAPGSTPHIQIRCEIPAAGIRRLVVEDKGIGIAPEHHERIFQPFHQLNPTDAESSGMGLAIVKKAVERMGGSVGLDSRAGEGSRFWIELPEDAD